VRIERSTSSTSRMAFIAAISAGDSSPVKAHEPAVGLFVAAARHGTACWRRDRNDRLSARFKTQSCACDRIGGLAWTYRGLAWPDRRVQSVFRDGGTNRANGT